MGFIKAFPMLAGGQVLCLLRWDLSFAEASTTPEHKAPRLTYGACFEMQLGLRPGILLPLPLWQSATMNMSRGGLLFKECSDMSHMISYSYYPQECQGGGQCRSSLINERVTVMDR